MYNIWFSCWLLQYPATEWQKVCFLCASGSGCYSVLLLCLWPLCNEAFFLWNKWLQGFFLAKHGIQELTCWIAWGTSQAWVWCPCQRGQCLSLTSLKKIRMYTELPLPLRKMADISCIIIVSHFDGNSFVKHLEWPVAVKVAREMQVLWSSKSFLNCDTDPSISVYHWLSKQPESEHFTKCMLHNVKASEIWQLPFANTLNPCYNIELNISFLYYVNPYSLVHIKVHITA